MERLNHDTNLHDPLTVVVALDDGQHSLGIGRTPIHKSLNGTWRDCLVLTGSSALTEMMRIQSGMQAITAVECPSIAMSVVVPVYNEEANIPELYCRLTETMAGLGEPYEFVLVDDGSQDRSLELLAEIQRRDPDHVRVISLARNFGHQAAISAGLDQARGRVVIVMDGDLQDPPEVIPQFVEKWRQGFHVVYAIREKRKECIPKRAAYHLFYLLLRSISKIDIPLEAGDFCLMDRCVVDVLTALPERNRFVRGLRSWVGFKQVGLAYERDARFAGRSKYTFSKLVGLALDGLISFSSLPLRLATMLGFGVSALSLAAAAYYLIKKLTIGVGPPGFATQVVLISFLGGVQLITIGVIGEYIGHVLDEVKRRPAYVVCNVLDGRDDGRKL